MSYKIKINRILRQEFPELKKWGKKVSGHQSAIVEVLVMSGKLLGNKFLEKIKNRDLEYYEQPLETTV